ncbi:hypothetical protein MMPV_006159 [Pyropia vietnamensis]
MASFRKATTVALIAAVMALVMTADTAEASSSKWLKCTGSFSKRLRRGCFPPPPPTSAAAGAACTGAARSGGAPAPAPAPGPAPAPAPAPAPGPAPGPGTGQVQAAQPAPAPASAPAPRIPAGQLCNFAGAICADGLVCRTGAGGPAGATCRYFVRPCSECNNAQALCWDGYTCTGGVCVAPKCYM